MKTLGNSTKLHQLRIVNGTAGVVLHVVAGFHALNFCAIEFGPKEPPVIGAEVFPRDSAIRRQFQSGAILRTRCAVGVTVLPLAKLCVTLNRIAQRLHAQSKLGDAERARRREVLVECHGFESVANGSSIGAIATLYKHRMLRVARATL
jgi:hypothetical protein